MTDAQRIGGGIAALIFGLGICVVGVPHKAQTTQHTKQHQVNEQHQVKMSWEQKRKAAFDRICKNATGDRDAEEIDFYVDSHGEPNYGISCGHPVFENIKSVEIKSYQVIGRDVWAIVPQQ